MVNLPKLLIIVGILLASCTDDGLIESKFDDLFTRNNLIKLPDTLGLSLFMHSTSIYQDSVVFFAELLSKSVYKFNFSDSSLQVVGKYGQGPGEHVEPRGIALKGDTLLTFDKVGLRLSKFNLHNLDFLEQIKLSSSVKSPFNFFPYEDSYWFFESTFNSDYLVDLKRAKQYIETANVFKKDYPRQIDPGSVLHQNHIYFMNSYESMVFKFNLLSHSLERINLKAIQPISYADYYDKTMNEDELDELKRKSYYFMFFDILPVDSELYFFICASFEEKANYFIFKENGDFVCKTDIPTNVIKTNSNKVIANFIDEKTGEIFISEYVLNKHKLKLLKEGN